ncbi:lytic transglycosylase domain-containing protein [Sulfitobacter sp. D35]|uniref:lytic transglycosylase domain-containing protein n=1 Tax=Sulfitobacter sp. D35 TaxID=3083252 RepID=UPI00296F5F09|nr:lytic transglycosylase domain-containing protein [Sulfitobacter sp. D35]MDW4499481.1 lytic transglycosylase domain-containing protein [Sulfitobacter sp. D35]
MRNLMTICLLAGALAAVQASADAPRPFPEFSAKRVTVPKAGQKRITVQIDPDEQLPSAPSTPLRPYHDDDPDTVVTAAAAPALPPGAVGQFSWFWDKVSPAAEQSGPGRLDMAMRTLAGAAGRVPAPRLQHMQSIARANGVDILKSTIGTSVSPALVLAVITVESAGRVNAVSHAGAQGLMQLMPDTAARFGVKDSLKSAENIAGGVKYLDWLMKEFGGDPILVLAGYNAGEGSVRKHAGVPPFAETRDYVPKVLAAFQVARGLCLTPPELITDGCVFAALN